MKGKRREHKYPVRKSPDKPAEKSKASDRLDLYDYVLMNGIFLAFCAVQLVLIRVLLPNALGLYFFFGFLVVGFAVVSMFDYFACRTTDDGIVAGQEQQAS